MNGQEVAKYLDVSRSAVDRYVARGKLSMGRRDDAGQPSYNEDEVRQLKQEMDSRVPSVSAARRHRHTLSLDEAIATTGLPRETILIRVIEGRLQARWRGNMVTLKRTEIEQLARGLE
jgi:hypothetical protein